MVHATWWHAETTYTVVGMLEPHVTENTKDMLGKTLISFVVGLNKPFKDCSLQGTSGWLLAEVFHKQE